ncbi:MAG TPA: glycosyltransferase [Gemmatimonadaceae bacterium]|nr:glycosyltransferase [Gemmatimonadaceae bacterium]
MAFGPPRIALFTHDAFGVGHIRRSSRILRAVAEKSPDSSLLLITGAPPTSLLRDLPQNADTIKIPTIITSGTTGTRPTTLNLGVAELASLRGELTRRALELFDPDVFLVDNFPLGTRLELLPALRELRHRPTRTVLGLRDVVDPPDKVRRDWERDGLYGIIERYYDRVLIYGVSEVLDAVTAYGLSNTIAERVFYCGYVTDSEMATRDLETTRQSLGVNGKGFFLATVGGGGDGRPLLEAFLAALEEFPERQAVVVAGEFMSSSDRSALLELARKNPMVTVHDHLTELPSAMAIADLVVAMGGYNTSAEIVSLGARAVVVPRTWRAGEHGTRGKTGVDGEQLVRAEGLARMGLITTLDGQQLSGATLADAMRRALSQPHSARSHDLDMNGAARVAEHLLELANRRS